MVARIVWSDEASEDLRQIVRYIARDSERYARQVASDVMDSLDRAAMFPRAGRVVPELDDPDVREVRVFSYRIIYRVKTEAVNVVAIIHGARNLLNALTGRTI